MNKHYAIFDKYTICVYNCVSINKCINIMIPANKKILYPENLPLKDKVKESGMSITFLANKIGVSRCVLSNLINGHYKGVRISAELEELLSK